MHLYRLKFTGFKLLLLLTISSFAQSAQLDFIELSSSYLGYSTMTAGDIDNDGDEDVLISGPLKLGEIPETYVYLNNNGDFILDTTYNFLGVRYGQLRIVDLNNDDFNDLVISGDYYNSTNVFEIYYGNSNGFNIQNNDFDTGMDRSELAIADFNSDGLKDIFIAGQTPLGHAKTYLLLNSDSGFITIPDTSLTSEQFFYSSLIKSDLDNDGNIEVIQSFHDKLLKYEYDSTGLHVVDLNMVSGFQSYLQGFLDYDNDNDLDIISSGYMPIGGSSVLRTFIINNQGSGNFSIDSNNLILDGLTRDGELLTQDYDNDGDLDFIFLGGEILDQKRLKIYENNNGVFQESPNTILGLPYHLDIEALVHFDKDNDGDEDLLIWGSGDSKYSGIILLEHISTAWYKRILHNEPLDIGEGDMELGDMDNDGDLDLIMGGNQSYGTFANSYLNDGQGHFSLDTNNFYNINSAQSNFHFTSVNDSNQLDLFYSYIDHADTFKFNLRKNIGNGVLDSPTSLFPYYADKIKSADVDDDGDIDVLVQFSSMFLADSTVKLFINDGVGNFSQSDQYFGDFQRGDIEFSDMDGDGDIDFILSGEEDEENYYKLVYFMNTGMGYYYRMDINNYSSNDLFDIEIADINGDGMKDIVTLGNNGIYFQDPFGGYYNSFESLPNLIEENIEMFDVDNDGDIDAIISGRQTNNLIPMTGLYLNNGLGEFSLDNSQNFIQVALGDLLKGDLDNDGDIDLILGGLDVDGNKHFEIYKNDGFGQFNQYNGTVCGNDTIAPEILWNDTTLLIASGDYSFHLSDSILATLISDNCGLDTFYSSVQYLNDCSYNNSTNFKHFTHQF